MSSNKIIVRDYPDPRGGIWKTRVYMHPDKIAHVTVYLEFNITCYYTGQQEFSFKGILKIMRLRN